MIEIFPEFTSFSFNIQNEYENFIKDFAPYGDFSFVNLVIWLNLENDLEISKLNKCLVLRFTNIFDKGRPKVYSIIGQENVDDAIDDLKLYFAQHNIDQKALYSVIQETADNLKKYKAVEDRDSFDYIYDIDDQIRLLGTKFGKIRRKVNNFIHTNGDFTIIKEIDLDNETDFNNLINAMHTWVRMYDLGGNDTEHVEARALSRSLKYHNKLGFRCIVVCVNGEIEAFTLFFINHSNLLANISHTKCSYEYKHLFDFTLYATASKLRTEGLKYFNLEQDLGIAGMREHKLSLRPAKMLKKYSVGIS